MVKNPLVQLLREYFLIFRMLYFTIWNEVSKMFFVLDGDVVGICTPLCCLFGSACAKCNTFELTDLFHSRHLDLVWLEKHKSS